MTPTQPNEKAAPLIAEGAAKRCDEWIDANYEWDKSGRGYINRSSGKLALIGDVVLAYAATETARADRAEQELATTKKECDRLREGWLAEERQREERIEAIRKAGGVFQRLNGELVLLIVDSPLLKSLESDLKTSNQHASELNTALAEARKALEAMVNYFGKLFVIDDDMRSVLDAARAVLAPNPSTPKETT